MFATLSRNNVSRTRHVWIEMIVAWRCKLLCSPLLLLLIEPWVWWGRHLDLLDDTALDAAMRTWSRQLMSVRSVQFEMRYVREVDG